MTKKFTKASFKSFIKKNKGNIWIKELSRFDGMYDSVMQNNNPKWNLARLDDRANCMENTLGYHGIWLVSGSGNYFTPHQENGFMGYKVYNCCGSFIVAVEATC